MEKKTDHRKPDPGNKTDLRGKEASSRNPGVNARNDSAQMRVKSPTNSKGENDKPDSDSRRVVTNHDEENKIVNGGSDAPMDEKENEGV